MFRIRKIFPFDSNLLKTLNYLVHVTYHIDQNVIKHKPLQHLISYVNIKPRKDTESKKKTGQNNIDRHIMHWMYNGIHRKNFSKPVSKVKGKRNLNTSIKCRQEWQDIVAELVQTRAVAPSSDNWVASVDQKSQHTWLAALPQYTSGQLIRTVSEKKQSAKNNNLLLLQLACSFMQVPHIEIYMHCIFLLMRDKIGPL